MHLLVRKRFCRSADRFPYSESRFLIGKAGIPACKIDCRSGTGHPASKIHLPVCKVICRLAQSFPNQQSHFPISKAVCQPAKLFASQQSRLLTGRVIPRSAESFADQQSYSAISKVVSCSAKAFPDQQSHFPIGKAISWFVRAVLGQPKIFFAIQLVGFQCDTVIKAISVCTAPLRGRPKLWKSSHHVRKRPSGGWLTSCVAFCDIDRHVWLAEPNTGIT